VAVRLVFGLRGGEWMLGVVGSGLKSDTGMEAKIGERDRRDLLFLGHQGGFGLL
jgi:hypothetical protein